MKIILASLVITAFATLTNADDNTGILTIDELGFNKLLPKYDVLIVKFDEAFPYGDKHAAFKEFAEKLSENPNIIVAQVKVKDTRNKANDEFAKKLGVDVAELPVIRMFVKDQKEPIAFGKDETWSEEQLLTLVKVNTRVYLGLPGRLEKFDKLAEKIMKSKKKEDVLKEAEKLSKKLKVTREQDIAKNYIKVMKKIIANGDSFVETEETRVKKLLKDGKMDAKKKKDLKERLNLLQGFETEAATKTEL